MTVEIRVPVEDEREGVLQVLRVSLNFSAERVRHRGPKLPLDQFLCAFDDGRVVSAAAAAPFTQWFGGAELPMAGVWGVATLPEHRGAGLASELAGRLVGEGRERGALISTLYPATLRPYRRLGFEIAGTYTEHRVALDDLPGDAATLPVDEYRPEDLDGVRACYRRVARASTGPIDSNHSTWWPSRILEPRMPDDIFRAVVVRGRDGIEGYSSFTYDSAEGSFGVEFGIDCNHFVASTEAALRSLLAYFRGFRGLGKTLTWAGPPFDPAAMLLAEQRLRPHWTFRWMSRLLDVPGALVARGYPPVSGSAVIEVDDPLFPKENNGPWLLTAERGSVTVERTEAFGGSPIPIGILSAMFTGFLSPLEAMRLGWLDRDDPAVEVLERLFAGAPPWMQDFF